jgi:hypothetical protein
MKMLDIPHGICENLGKADRQAGFYDFCFLCLYLKEQASTKQAHINR